MKDEPKFNFDLERMKEAVEGSKITIPSGLSKEAIREYLIKYAYICNRDDVVEILEIE